MSSCVPSDVERTIMQGQGLLHRCCPFVRQFLNIISLTKTCFIIDRRKSKGDIHNLLLKSPIPQFQVIFGHFWSFQISLTPHLKYEPPALNVKPLTVPLRVKQKNFGGIPISFCKNDSNWAKTAHCCPSFDWLWKFFTHFIF